MTADELYYEGQEKLCRALENTQYTHIHSVDIRRDVFNSYTLPAAKQGSIEAIKAVANKYIREGSYGDAIPWVQKYKNKTNCSMWKLTLLFGRHFLKYLIYID